MTAKVINRRGEDWTPHERDDHYRDKLRSLLKVTETGCWEYQGWRNEWGYGTMGYRNKSWMVPRLAYVLWKGPIPKGHYICHTCDNPPCANPDHLWAGKSRENLKDCVAKGRHDQASRTVCVNGHPLTPENTRVHFEVKTGKTKRHCKKCELARCRMRLGWPRDLAMTLPAGARGYRPTEVGPTYGRGKYDRKEAAKRRASRTGG